MERMTYQLWENGAPGFEESYGQAEPTVTAYLLKNGRKNGCVIVCPGGAYVGKAKHECGVVAEMLNEKGVSAFTLDYRVAPYQYPYITEDVLRAVRFVRYHAAQFGIDPEKIGVLGFSAGGHLASSAMGCFDYGKEGDEIDRVSSRPDFGILCYPVISFDKYMHAGSRQRLIGGLPNEKELAVQLSLELNVKSDTPPVFIWHTMDDSGVDARNSLELALAYRTHRIPCELHIFRHGKHGVGLGEGYHNVWQWVPLLGEWLKESGIVPVENEAEA